MARRAMVALVCFVIFSSASPLRGAAARTWEGKIMIPTYLLGPPDPNPPFSLTNRHDIYPYPMLDDLTDQREMRSYRALFLENDYLRATILPEVGGRLYSLFDKVGKREVFYRNHVVKYGLVALRGAWISGGVEFNFPNGHTTLTVSPVESRLIENRDGSATVVVGATDWVTEMHWEVALTLRPGEARLEQHVTLFNSTPQENLYWYWANAAVPATDDMQFDYPMREANPHMAGVAWTFPVWKGVDYSRYKNIRQPTSLFARQVHRDFFAAYYGDSDYAVVHVADYREVPGKKIWSWGVAGDGLIWTNLLTDRDGPYNEIQSGRYETQLTQEFMPPQRVESWTEFWYPVQGLGSACVEATDSLALALKVHLAGLEASFRPPIDISGARVSFKQGEGRTRTVIEYAPVDFRAGTVKRFIPFGAGENVDQQSKTATVDVTDRLGRTILHWAAADPVDGNPDFVSGAGRHTEAPSRDPQSAVEATFLRGVDEEKHGNEEGAVGLYRDALDQDPAYIPALLKLAWRSYGAADFVAAENFVKRGLARSGTDPRLQYVAGAIYRAEGRSSPAEDAFWTSIHFGAPMVPALVQLGEISIREKHYEEAARLLRDALNHEPENTLARTDLAVALRLGGHAGEAHSAVDAALSAMPLFPFALAEAWRLHNGKATGSSTAAGWDKALPDDVQYRLDIAAWYLRLGDMPSATDLLQSVRGHVAAGPNCPLLDYYLAYLGRQQGNGKQVDGLTTTASHEADLEVFPNRIEDEIVLADALKRAPNDGHAASLLGTFLFAHDRYDDGARLWRQAVKQGFDNSVIERNLGLYDWRVKKDLQGATDAYAKAIQFAPDQYRLYPDLDEIYSELGDSAKRAQLFAAAPPAVLNRDVVRVRRALLMVEQGQFDGALESFADHHFKPWEGGAIVREMYVLANLEEGRTALRKGSAAEAEQNFRRGLEYPENLGVGKPDRPADGQSFYWLGEALAAQGKKEDAQVAWRQATNEAAESDTTTQVYKGAALVRLGEKDEGQRLLHDAIGAAGPRDVGSSEFYAAGLAESFEGNPEQARRDFQRALELNPSCWQCRVELERPPASSGPPVPAE